MSRTKKVVKAKAPSQKDLQNRINALQEDRDEYAAELGQVEASLEAAEVEIDEWRGKYQALRNRIERGLSLWDHVTIIFGVSNILDGIE